MAHSDTAAQPASIPRQLAAQPQPAKTLSGIVLDSLWLWTTLCLVTLFAYLTWAIVEVQNHYYFVTVPFTTVSARVP